MNTAGYDKRLASEPYPSTPGLCRIEAAAKQAGMSANLLEAGIEAGQVPVTLRRVGPGNRRFVNVEQLHAWINGTAAARPTAPAEDLFEEGTKQ